MTTEKTHTLYSPLDMHLHLRQGDMLKLVAPLSAEQLCGAVIMPNLTGPIDSTINLQAYRQDILEAIGNNIFTPYMTLFFRNFTETELQAALSHIIGLKLYPAGITTNSENGVKGMEKATPTLALMQEMGIPLLIHGESDGFVLDREKEFLPTYANLAESFPSLKIIMEHITTREALQLLDQYENLYATVTLHHLMLSLDDVAGGLLSPHLFCKPIAKHPKDRDALLEAALRVHPKIMFGSDSAPHPVHKKECAGCAAGIFTAPVVLPLLTELFEKHNALENLQTFVSDNAQRIYNITPPDKAVTLHKSDWTVPCKYGNVVPFMAGKNISWKLS